MKRESCIPIIFCSLPGVIIVACSALSVADPGAVDLKPITITVSDAKTGSPVTNFAYQFAFKTPGSNFDSGGVWQRINSPHRHAWSSVFRILVP